MVGAGSTVLKQGTQNRQVLIDRTIDVVLYRQLVG
jgi:hypothetical protein